jgi:hypothetical protein
MKVKSRRRIKIGRGKEDEQHGRLFQRRHREPPLPIDLLPELINVQFILDSSSRSVRVLVRGSDGARIDLLAETVDERIERRVALFHDLIGEPRNKKEKVFDQLQRELW